MQINVIALTVFRVTEQCFCLWDAGGSIPNITVELLSGRTLDQRRHFAEAVTAAAVDILKARRAAVRIRFDEIEREDVANGGTLGVRPHLTAVAAAPSCRSRSDSPDAPPSSPGDGYTTYRKVTRELELACSLALLLAW